MCKNIIHFYIIVILSLFGIPFIPTYHHAYEPTTSYSIHTHLTYPSCTWTYLFIFLCIHVFLSSFFLFSLLSKLSRIFSTHGHSCLYFKNNGVCLSMSFILTLVKPNHLTPFINMTFFYFIKFIFLKVNNLPLSNLST